MFATRYGLNWLSVLFKHFQNKNDIIQEKSLYIYIMNKDDINKWAKRLRAAHKNPLTKLELPGTKFLVPTGSENEADTVKNSLETLTNVLYTERVERRCARSIANWLPEQKLAEVTKIIGVLKNFGFANKNGKFLYPEEALFLLETNRLELLWNNVPVSIQQAYKIILNDSDTTLAKYMTYRKLTLQGFRLVQTEHIQKQEVVGEPSPKKCRLTELQEVPKNPKIKQSLESDEIFKEMFKELQEHGPKKFNPHKKTKPGSGYELFKADNCSRTSSDFNLDIFQGKCIEPNLSFLDDKVPTVIGYTDTQFVGYFRIGHVDLPDLT